MAPALLPVLKTDLDDFDASTRELCCLSLDLMFKALPGALSEQPVHELYPSLLKRLDDSADPVRSYLELNQVAAFTKASQYN